MSNERFVSYENILVPLTAALLSNMQRAYPTAETIPSGRPVIPKIPRDFYQIRDLCIQTKRDIGVFEERGLELEAQRAKHALAYYRLMQNMCVYNFLVNHLDAGELKTVIVSGVANGFVYITDTLDKVNSRMRIPLPDAPFVEWKQACDLSL